MNAAGARPALGQRRDRVAHRRRRSAAPHRPRPRRSGRGRCRARRTGWTLLGLRLRAQRVVDGARRDLVGRGRPAVVGVADAEHVRAPGRRAGESQREVVGLRAGRDQEDALERIGQQRRQPLGEARHALIEEARVRVEQPQLARRGGRHARMAVADAGDVVDAVEVGAGVRVVEVLTRARAPSRAARA